MLSQGHYMTSCFFALVMQQKFVNFLSNILLSLLLVGSFNYFFDISKTKENALKKEQQEAIIKEEIRQQSILVERLELERQVAAQEAITQAALALYVIKAQQMMQNQESKKLQK